MLGLSLSTSIGLDMERIWSSICQSMWSFHREPHMELHMDLHMQLHMELYS